MSKRQAVLSVALHNKPMIEAEEYFNCILTLHHPQMSNNKILYEVLELHGDERIDIFQDKLHRRSMNNLLVVVLVQNELQHQHEHHHHLLEPLNLVNLQSPRYRPQKLRYSLAQSHSSIPELLIPTILVFLNVIV